jgi:DNA polymerase-3 subunit alpha
MGIQILPPDVNLSDHEFVVVDGDIRFGLDAVKGVGYSAVEAIKAARAEGGPFASIWDFCERVDPQRVNKKAIEALVKCGAFGSTGASRKGMLGVLEQAQAAGQKSQLDAQIGQGSIFDMLGGPAESNGNGAAEAFAAPSHPPIPPDEFEQHDLLAIEKESIGLFISAHPLKQVREALRLKVDVPLAQIEESKDGSWVTIGGIVTQARKIRTRSGTTMMFATLDDLEATVELTIFEKALAECESALAVDEVVLVRGRFERKDGGKVGVVVQDVTPFKPSQEEVEAAKDKVSALDLGPRPVRVFIDAKEHAATIIDELKHVLELYPGETEVVLDIDTSGGRRLLRLGQGYRVAETPSLRAELGRILGPRAVAQPATAALAT